jgi:O-antigen ligase
MLSLIKNFVITNCSNEKFLNKVLSILISSFLIVATFNFTFSFRLFFFLLCIILLTLLNFKKYNSFKIILKNNNHILLFTFFFLISFFFINDDYNFNYYPQIINVLCYTLLAILLINQQNIFDKVMKYTSYILVIILLISLFYHFFILESKLLTASLFFSEFEKDDHSTKNTLVILLCIMLPYLIYQISYELSFINTFIFSIFLLSIYYTFSRTGIVLYFFILIAIIFTFKRKFAFTSIFIFFATLLILLLFQISFEKYNYFKGLANKQILNQNYNAERIAKTFSYESDRFKYIKFSYEGFKEKPLLGHGTTKFYQNSKEYDDQKILKRKPISHNDYATILYEQGIIGILIVCYFLWVIFRKLIFNIPNDKFALVKIIQFLTLIFALNFINLIDHAIFWIFISLLSNFRVLNNKAIKKG